MKAGQKNSAAQDVEILYALLGEYVAKFELILFKARNFLSFFADLQPTLDKIHSLLDNRAEFTAGPLMNQFHAHALRLPGITKGDRRVLAAISKRAKALVKKRNEVVHSTWFIVPTQHPDNGPPKAKGIKLRTSKQGGGYKTVELSAALFKPAIAECEIVGELVSRAAACMMGGFSLERNFLFKGAVIYVPTRAEIENMGPRATLQDYAPPPRFK